MNKLSKEQKRKKKHHWPRVRVRGKSSRKKNIYNLKNLLVKKNNNNKINTLYKISYQMNKKNYWQRVRGNI